VGALLRSELFRVRRRTQSWILIAIVAAIAVLFYGSQTIAHFVQPDSQSILERVRLSTIYDNGLAFVAPFGSILVVVFASSLIGSEYGWNTLRPVLARARSRSALLTAKWLTVALFVAVVAVVGVLTTILGATVASLVVGEGFDWSISTPFDTIAISARFVAGFLPTAALAMFVALAARSNAAGIAIGMSFRFVEPYLFVLLRQMNDVFDTIQKGTISRNDERLFSLGGANDLTRGDAWVSAGILAVWVALFVALSYRIFDRRDVTSG
jgi:ABC-2 type transport system permease protein